MLVMFRIDVGAGITATIILIAPFFKILINTIPRAARRSNDMIE